MGLQAVAEDETCRNEKTRAGYPVQDQEQARGEEDSKGQQTDAGGDEPGPGREGHAGQGHSLCAQVKSGRDEVERSKNGSNAEDKDRKSPEGLAPPLTRASIRTDCAQRSVRCPAG